MNRYTLHLRAKNGTRFDIGVDRVPHLNILAQEHIKQGSIVLGFTSPHTYKHETVRHAGTLHLGKERDPKTMKNYR